MIDKPIIANTANEVSGQKQTNTENSLKDIKEKSIYYQKFVENVITPFKAGSAPYQKDFSTLIDFCSTVQRITNFHAGSTEVINGLALDKEEHLSIKISESSGLEPYVGNNTKLKVKTGKGFKEDESLSINVGLGLSIDKNKLQIKIPTPAVGIELENENKLKLKIAPYFVIRDEKLQVTTGNGLTGENKLSLFLKPLSGLRFNGEGELFIDFDSSCLMIKDGKLVVDIDNIG